MSAAEQVGTNTPEPMALVRAIRRMNKAGFELRVTAGRLQVASADNLTDTQRAYLREHKPALVQLLTDAERLAELLAQAGTEGLGWLEGTPDWTDAYLLAVNELLYSDKRMVNRAERRYLAAAAPPLPDYPDTTETPEIAVGAKEPPISTEEQAPASRPMAGWTGIQLRCTWNGLGRLVAKCAQPEPNEEGTGCKTCGAVKEVVP